MSISQRWQSIERWYSEHKFAGALIIAVSSALFAALVCGLVIVYLTPLLQHLGKGLVPPTPIPAPTTTPLPTPTPDWQMQEEVSRFLRGFWRAQETAFETGELDPLETFFCTDGRFQIPLLVAFDPFSQYKADAEDLMASGLCPFKLLDMEFPDDAPSKPGSLQAMTVERWAEGPCPTDGSSGLEGWHRRFVVERNDSGWCIGESSPWQVVPE